MSFSSFKCILMPNSPCCFFSPTAKLGKNKWNWNVFHIFMHVYRYMLYMHV